MFVNRVLLCTSPLQVINARAAMSYTEKDNLIYKDFIFIIHPLLTEMSMQIINKYSNKLNYKECLNFNYILKESPRYKNTKKLYNKIDREITNKNKSDNNIRIDKNDKLFIEKIINKIMYKIQTKGISEESIIIKKEIKNNVGHIDEVFMRFNYNAFEQQFIDAFENQPTFYAIEDGFADYKANKHFRFSIYNFVHNLKELNYKLILGFLQYCFGFKKKYKPKFELIFSNVESSNKICIKDYFLNLLQKLSISDKSDKKPIVIILGSPLMVYPGKYKMTIKKEVEIYNRLIEKITLKHNISNNQIYYKHHPRLIQSSWEYKRNYLNCNIYDYSFDDIVEVDLYSKNVIALYSVGSTSQIYSKEFFGIETYFIDLRKEKIHPTHFHEIYNVFKDFDIQPININ